MIKLKRPSEPPERLTAELVREKTDEYKESKKDVWNIPWLREAILNLSYSKCCYSEIRLNEESKYMEIDHFHPKSLFSNEVMDWNNLLPSCKKCNITKGEHNTKEHPVVNPFIDNPKEYFYIEDGFYKVKSSLENKDYKKGVDTLEKLGLNDLMHFITPRVRLSKRFKETLSDISKIIDGDIGYIKRLKELMQEGKREEPYAALKSTTILTDKNYQHIEQSLKEKLLWDAELQALKAELEFCALIK